MLSSKIYWTMKNWVQPYFKEYIYWQTISARGKLLRNEFLLQMALVGNDRNLIYLIFLYGRFQPLKISTDDKQKKMRQVCALHFIEFQWLKLSTTVLLWLVVVAVDDLGSAPNGVLSQTKGLLLGQTIDTYMLIQGTIKEKSWAWASQFLVDHPHLCLSWQQSKILQMSSYINFAEWHLNNLSSNCHLKDVLLLDGLLCDNNWSLAWISVSRIYRLLRKLEHL